MDSLRIIQPPQRVEPQSGQIRPVGRGGVGSAFSEVLARAVARREPVHVGAEVRDRLLRSETEWTPELQAHEEDGRFVQRGSTRGVVLHDARAFVLSVPERELVDVVKAEELGNGVVDGIDAFALVADAN